MARPRSNGYVDVYLGWAVLQNLKVVFEGRDLSNRKERKNISENFSADHKL
jgi:hypothetical protein